MSVRLLTIAAFTSALCSAQAFADDTATIADCMAAEANRYTCIGRISQPCMEEHGGDTTLGMKMCAVRETDAWDALLNAEYQRLLGNLEGKAKDKLRAAQRAWISMRDGDCALPYAIYEGGTLAGVLAATCLLDRTATRTIQIRDLRESSDSH